MILLNSTLSTVSKFSHPTRLIAEIREQAKIDIDEKMISQFVQNPTLQVVLLVRVGSNFQSVGVRTEKDENIGYMYCKKKLWLNPGMHLIKTIKNY